MAYLSKDRGPNTSLQGAILQAPVSDRQDFEHNHPASDPSSAEDLELLQKATELVNAGKGWTLLPRTPPASERSNTDTQTEKEEDDGDDDDDEDEKSIVLNPPMTAYRFWSLNAKGGDDDYFSSDLDEQTLRRNWETTAARAPILALMGAEE